MFIRKKGKTEKRNWSSIVYLDTIWGGILMESTNRDRK